MRFGVARTALLLGLWGCSPRGGLPELESESRYVGQRRGPGPREAGALLGFVLPNVGEHEYSVEVRASGADTLLFLERLTGRDARGRPGFEVVAAVRHPHVPAGHQLAAGVCRVRGTPDSRVIAVVRAEDKELYTHVTAAWRADAAAAKFVPIPVDGIDCVNEGYGA